MFEAIHKPTGRRVSAHFVNTNLEFQGKQKDEFTAPLDLAENAEELFLHNKKDLKCVFVVEHYRNKDTDNEEFVSAHFRCLDEGFIENKWITESKEHKLAKQYIYDKWRIIKVYDGQNEYLLKDLDVEDIKIEKGVGFKRADVLVSFSKPHEIFGKGICFEIQLSLQDTKETFKRTFDRCAYGYSVCWIWSDQLEKYDSIRFRIIPFREGIDNYIKELQEGYDLEFSNLALKINSLYTDKLKEIYNILEKNNKALYYMENSKTEIEEITTNFKDKIIHDAQFWYDGAKKTILSDVDIKVKEESQAYLDNLKWENIILPIIQNNKVLLEKVFIELIKTKYDFKPQVEETIKLLSEENKIYARDIIKAEVKTFIESGILNLISERINLELNKLIPKMINEHLETKYELIKKEAKESIIKNIQLDLLKESTLMYLKNKCEIFLEDPETKKMYNIHEFSIKSDSDGNLKIKRVANGESKN